MDEATDYGLNNGLWLKPQTMDEAPNEATYKTLDYLNSYRWQNIDKVETGGILSTAHCGPHCADNRNENIESHGLYIAAT